MRKIYKTLLASALLLMLHVSMAMGANIAYSLSRHTLADGDANKTITASATLNAGASLLDNMPQALWRAYCTYKFYSDPAMNTEITEAPSTDATVYVDYVFDPPFILSKEGEDPVWHNLRTYNKEGQNKYIMYLKQKAYPEYEGVFAWKGTSYPSYGGANSQMGIKTDCEWAFYGDAYDLSLRINDGTYGENDWLIWQNTTSGAILQLGAKPSIGWQLLVNNTYLKNASTNYQAVPYPTMSLGVPNSNLFASLADVNYAVRTSTLNNISLNNKNEITANTTDANARANLWWYAFYATPVGSGSDLRYYVTYKILQRDGVNWYPDVIKAKSATEEQKPNVPDFTGKRSDCIYDGYYKDSEFSEKYPDDYMIPVTGNTVIYIKESYKNGEPFVTDHWITLALSYKVDNLASEFGYASDGTTPAVRVLEYTALTTNASNTKYTLTFTETDKIVAHKPYLFKADEVLEGKNLCLSKDPDWGNKSNEELEEMVNRETSKIKFRDESHTSPYVTMIGTYLDKELTVQTQHPDLLYFYFGYDKRYDPESDAYEPAAAEGKLPYNFYRVTSKNVTIHPFHCYFMIEGAPAGAKFMMMDNFGNEITSVEGIDADSFIQTTGRIYNLNGQVVGNDLEALPRGVYIVNGKKVMK